MKNLLSISIENLSNRKIIDWGYTEVLEAVSFDKYKNWVDKDLHLPLTYLSDHRLEKRKNLQNFYPSAASSLVFLFQYTETKKALLSSNMSSNIAAYTLGFEGEDYHFWIKKQLEEIGAALQSEVPELEFKITLDIHPVLDRDLAYRSGLGWFGKNSMLISQTHGSYFLIGSIILNKKLFLNTNSTVADHCGSCTRCLDACPTSAIIPGEYTIDTKKCISTHTIELFKDVAPPKGYPTKTKEIFGCDICQDVCPWNSKPLGKIEEGELDSKLVTFFNRDISEIYLSIKDMSNNEFKRFFFGTSFYRSGKRGILKNLKPYLLKL